MGSSAQDSNGGQPGEEGWGPHEDGAYGSTEDREDVSMKVKRCDHCGSLYMPDKFHPRQRFCTDPECVKDRRRAYKREYNKEWRQKNPNYFKEYWLRYREL